MEHTKHIWRAIIILVIVGVGGFVTRHFLIPESFGEAGHFRYNSLYEFMAQTPLYQAGDEACGACHSDQFTAKTSGKHASVHCEACHGPLPTAIEVHAEPKDPSQGDTPRAPENGGMMINREPSLCAYCHLKLDARPESMPQIDFTEHLVTLGVIEAGAPVPEGACIVCHDVHNPALQ